MDKNKILEMLSKGEITLEEATKMMDEVDKVVTAENLGETISSVVREKILKATDSLKDLDVKVRTGFNKAKFGKAFVVNMHKRDDEEDDDSDELSGWDAIKKLAPFTSAKALGELIERELEKDSDVKWENVLGLAPFIESETLVTIANFALKQEKPNTKFIVKLAPFMDSDDLAELVKMYEGSLSIKFIVKIAPFLEEDVVDELVMKLASQVDDSKATEE